MHWRSRLGSTAFATIVLSLLIASCTSSPSAHSLARQSCGGIDLAGGSSTVTIGKATKEWVDSASLAAKAASIDPRWTSLLTAELAQAQAWRDIGHSIGMGVTSDSQHWTEIQKLEAQIPTASASEKAASREWKTIQVQCTIARS